MERVFAVVRARGPAWDDSKPLEGQLEWTAHAAFMDDLFYRRIAALVGPLEGTRDALLILRASSASEIVERLALDPWTTNGLLVTRQISPGSSASARSRAGDGAVTFVALTVVAGLTLSACATHRYVIVPSAQAPCIRECERDFDGCLNGRGDTCHGVKYSCLRTCRDAQSDEGTCEKARRLRIWTEGSCFDFRLRQYVLAK